VIVVSYPCNYGFKNQNEAAFSKAHEEYFQKKSSKARMMESALTATKDINPAGGSSLCRFSFSVNVVSYPCNYGFRNLNEKLSTARMMESTLTATKDINPAGEPSQNYLLLILHL